MNKRYLSKEIEEAGDKLGTSSHGNDERENRCGRTR